MIVLRLAIALFLVQAGFHAWTASLPLALARAGAPDASIGLVMGVAALVQIPAAVAGGRLVDAFGGTRLLTIGGIAYLLGSAVLLGPGVDARGSLVPFVAVRMLQGIGIGVALPAALSLVPRMLPPARQASGLAWVGAAHNLTLVLLPPLSIAILDAASLHAVAVSVLALVVAGMVLTQGLPLDRPGTGGGAGAGSPMRAASRRFGITFRREWAVPLLVIVTYVAHWGAVTAYLPVRAEQAGADIGLYFSADGVAIFLMRLPTGWLLERFSLRGLVLTGAAATAIAISLLLLPPTTPLLVVSGLLGGAGGAIVMTPITIELSRRSSDADRGSAFALFSGGLAAAMTLGSIGGAPIVAVLGLSAALVVGIALIGVSMALTALDPSLAPRQRAGGVAVSPRARPRGREA